MSVIDLTAPSPKFRKRFGILQIAVALLAIVAMYVQETQPNPPRWLDLALPVLVTIIGLQILLFESQLSRSWQIVGAAVCFAGSAMLFIRFFV